MRRETALLRRVAVGGNRCAWSAHPQAIGTVMVMLQGAYTDFLKGASRPSAELEQLRVRVHWLAPPGLHQVSESERFLVNAPSRRGSRFF